MKTCPKCNESDIAEFGKNRSTKDGLTVYCRRCHNRNYKEWRERMRGTSAEDKIRESGRKSNQRYREKNPGRDLDYYYKNKERIRAAAFEQRLIARYGITQDDWDRMYEQQNGRCAICRTDKPGAKGTFHVDHCHTTGDVRGLLCTGCNFRLGVLENAEWCEKALDYLDGSDQ
jgi:hypothetical protein